MFVTCVTGMTYRGGGGGGGLSDEVQGADFPVNASLARCCS